MRNQALGLIETVGLTAGLEAADAAVKAANIELLGYELTKGGGMVTVKISGDVGAVTAAVAAATAAAGKLNTVVSAHVIPRPHSGLDRLIHSRETVDGSSGDIPGPQPAVESGDTAAAPSAAPAEPGVDFAAGPGNGTCNLCGDPECTRRKGDPRIQCIHYSETHKEDE
ncbi:MAG: BMC domain-containing protein [Sporomusaceae bacterium]|nr:BMC domain-containing protein [Sporomusaceae bacterium]